MGRWHGERYCWHQPHLINSRERMKQLLSCAVSGRIAVISHGSSTNDPFSVRRRDTEEDVNHAQSNFYSEKDFSLKLLWQRVLEGGVRNLIILQCRLILWPRKLNLVTNCTVMVVFCHRQIHERALECTAHTCILLSCDM